MAAKQKDSELPAPPVLRYAPLGELKIYPVYEHELDMLKQGSPVSLFLNFALFLLPIGLTLIFTLATTTIPVDRLFQTYVLLAGLTIVSGLVLLALWWRGYKGSKDLVEEIKKRMPPPPPIQLTVSNTLDITDTTAVRKPGEGE